MRLKRDTIFMHIQKVAGNSIRDRFDSYENFHATSFHGREWAKDKVVDNARVFDPQSEFWRRSFVFSFVRNPFDRTVSALYFINQMRGKLRIEPIRMCELLEIAGSDPQRSEFVEPEKNYSSAGEYWGGGAAVRDHCKPYSNSGYRLDLCDFVGRFERLREDIATISEIIGAEGRGIRRLNTTDRPSYRDVLTAHDRATIEELYGDEIERFGYSF